MTIAVPERRLERPRVVAHGVEDAPLALDPVRLLRAEQAIEQPMRDHLGRKRAIAAGPAHVPLDALAEGFLAHADLQGAEPAVVADFLGDHLVDGWAARAAAREHRA